MFTRWRSGLRRLSAFVFVSSSSRHPRQLPNSRLCDGKPRPSVGDFVSLESHRMWLGFQVRDCWFIPKWSRWRFLWILVSLTVAVVGFWMKRLIFGNSYTSSDGQSRSEKGLKTRLGEAEFFEVTGSYRFQAPDGKIYVVEYTAGVDGYKATVKGEKSFTRKSLFKAQVFKK